MSHDDFHVEPIPGLPAVPPEGERILWSGSPNWPSLARHAFHIDKVAIYFAFLIAWRMGSQWQSGGSAADVLGAAIIPLVIAAAALTILATIAYATARSTIYTITSRRVVMRFGVALPITFNIPFASIARAELRKFADATGDLPVEQSEAKRLPYFVLWPHVRPWRFKSPQPMLRCLGDASQAATILSEALAAHAVGSPLTVTHQIETTRETRIRAPQLVAAE
jgi:hypothetical protein